MLASWLENPYWQYFCGEEYFRHELPCAPGSLVRWRQRVGVAGIERLLKESLDTAQRRQALKSAELQRVNVDTTLQEKTIAFPTDARLYCKARRALVRLARTLHYKLRQSYERIGKKALLRQGRYAAAQQMKRARQQTKKLRTYLGRVLRNNESGVEASDAAAQKVPGAANLSYFQGISLVRAGGGLQAGTVGRGASDNHCQTLGACYARSREREMAATARAARMDDPR